MSTQAPEHRTTPAASPSSDPSEVKAPPLFVSPSRRRPPATGSSPSPTLSTTTPAAEAGAAWDAWAAGGPADPLGDTATPSSADDAGAERDTPLRLGRGKKPLREVARGLVATASLALHERLTASELERAAGVWLIEDEDDAAAIADPATNLVTRRTGGALVSADAADLIDLAIAVAGYVITNAVEAFRIRRAVRHMDEAGIMPAPDER